MSTPNTTREMREDPLLGYDVWRSMHKRCKDPKTNGYDRYGGRGISVCSRWDSFSNFCEDMGPRPSKKHQLDRIDNSSDYSPENCRWVTAKENQANKTEGIVKITFNGKTQLLVDWANDLGIAPASLSWRMRRWPLERCLTEGRGKTGPKKPKRG